MFASVATTAAIIAAVIPAMALPALVDPTDNTMLAKREGTSHCRYWTWGVGPSLFGGFDIFTEGWGSGPNGCGGGVLNNLRGQCGSVEKWGCSAGNKNGIPGTYYSFELLAGAAFPGCVQDAVWLASPQDDREDGLVCYVG